MNSRNLRITERETLILDTAERLFYARGIHAVGMDELVRETGLGKMTVYRAFPTKDVLVGAYLARRSAVLLGSIDADIAANSDNPYSALLAVLDSVLRDTMRTGFRGCPFYNASVEFADADHPARVMAAAYKQGLVDRLRLLAGRLHPGRGDELAARLALIIDGMYLSAGILGSNGPASYGHALARQVIDGR